MEQPNTTTQELLDDILENGVDIIEVRGKQHRIGWLKKGIIRKLTHVILTCDKEDELSAKCASLVLLNSYWKVFFFHWIYWRYLWLRYSDEELLEVFLIAKKKVDSQRQAYFTNTIYLIGMKDTIMTMTKKEAERTLQELRQVRPSPTEKNTPN